eukprot:TRINITY_DN4202_c0_g1_i3.p2 TRINITY_DN4202_c0_g1~~TRINITY_DN4202_c0_g1_i3.p2  ORF type:complete len:222 (+),score=-18.19 TRINITY_DN4202_c0_g1_i3:271-936(+)
MYACVRKILITCGIKHTAQKRFQKVVNTSFNYKIIFKKIGIYRYQIKKFPNINTKQQTKDKYKDQLITNNQQIQIKKLSTNQQIPLNKYTSTKTNTTYSIFIILLFIAWEFRNFTQQFMYPIYNNCNTTYLRSIQVCVIKIIIITKQQKIKKYQNLQPSISTNFNQNIYSKVTPPIPQRVKKFNTIQPRILIQTYLFKLYIQSKNMQYKIGQHILHTQIHF